MKVVLLAFGFRIFKIAAEKSVFVQKAVFLAYKYSRILKIDKVLVRYAVVPVFPHEIFSAQNACDNGWILLWAGPVGKIAEGVVDGYF